MKQNEGMLYSLQSAVGIPDDLKKAHQEYFRGWEGKSVPLLDSDYHKITDTCKRLGWQP